MRVILETRRLALRPFTEDDVDNLFGEVGYALTRPERESAIAMAPVPPDGGAAAGTGTRLARPT